jgi:hypothetical protein
MRLAKSELINGWPNKKRSRRKLRKFKIRLMRSKGRRSLYTG